MALFEPAESRKAISSQLVWFGFWLTLTGIGAWLTPDKSGHGTHQQLGLPPCPSVLLFDRPCPGCGLTTSWTALIHGDLAGSFHDHPLGPFLYLLFTASALFALVAWIRKMRFVTNSKEFNRILGVTVTIFITFGLIRMAVTPNFANQNEHWFSLLNGR